MQSQRSLGPAHSQSEGFWHEGLTWRKSRHHNVTNWPKITLFFSTDRNAIGGLPAQLWLQEVHQILDFSWNIYSLLCSIIIILEASPPKEVWKKMKLLSGEVTLQYYNCPLAKCPKTFYSRYSSPYTYSTPIVFLISHLHLLYLSTGVSHLWWILGPLFRGVNASSGQVNGLSELQSLSFYCTSEAKSHLSFSLEV